MSAPPVKYSPPVGANPSSIKIRATLTGCEITPLEAACAELRKQAIVQDAKVKGPVRMPTKILKLTVRKSPCGEGTNTWDRFQMRIHKRVLDFTCPLNVFEQITKNYKMPAGVGVDLIVSNQKE